MLAGSRLSTFPALVLLVWPLCSAIPPPQAMRLPKHQARLLFGHDLIDTVMLRWLEVCSNIAQQANIPLVAGEAAIAELFRMFDDLMGGLDRSFGLYKVCLRDASKRPQPGLMLQGVF